MTLCTADFEAGVDGSEILTTDTGSATAWDAAEIGWHVMHYSSAQVAHGTLSAKIDTSSVTAAKVLQWSTALGTVTDHYSRFYIYLTALPGSDTWIWKSGTNMGPRLQTNGIIRLWSDTAVVGDAASALATATWYRVELHVVNSTTVGEMDLRIYEGDSTSTYATVSGTGLNTAASATEVRFGCCEASNTSWIMYLDDVVAGATSWVGPVAGAAQTLLPSADSVDGTWHDNGGGTALAAAIDETTFSDSDYITSELHPTTSTSRIKLASGIDPASSTGHVIHWRVRKDAAVGDTVDMTVTLRQGGGNALGGGTQIATFTRTNVDGTGWTTYDETLSGGEADSITDYSDLYLEFTADT